MCAREVGARHPPRPRGRRHHQVLIHLPIAVVHAQRDRARLQLEMPLGTFNRPEFGDEHLVRVLRVRGVGVEPDAHRVLEGEVDLPFRNQRGLRVQVVGMILTFRLFRLFATALHRVRHVGALYEMRGRSLAGAVLPFRGRLLVLVLQDRLAIIVARHAQVDRLPGLRQDRVRMWDFHELGERDEFPRIRVPTHTEVDLSRTEEPAQRAPDLRGLLEPGPQVHQNRLGQPRAFAVVRVAGGRHHFQCWLLLRELGRERAVDRVDDVRDRLLAPRRDVGVRGVAAFRLQPFQPVATEQKQDRPHPRLVEPGVVVVLDREAGEAVEPALVFFALFRGGRRRHERGLKDRVPATVVGVSGGGHARTIERGPEWSEESAYERSGFGGVSRRR